MINYQDKINELFNRQKNDWKLFRDNLEGLKAARMRTFYFDKFSMNVQFNPERIRSSSARVDKESINQRKCFLCAENRPVEQESVIFMNDYEFLCNPYPIFYKHFTISNLDHIPQEIGSSFNEFLRISRELPELVVFYNAPNCGASAPDHLHFQAGNQGFLPVEQEIDDLKNNFAKNLRGISNSDVFAIDDGLRRFMLIESNDSDSVSRSFQVIRNFLTQSTDDEPMLNILSYYRKNCWQLIVFLRKKHRPWQYFETGRDNILLSPASVDYGGTLITPLEKDFVKINPYIIEDIFDQVSISPSDFCELQEYFELNIASKV